MDRGLSRRTLMLGGAAAGAAASGLLPACDRDAPRGPVITRFVGQDPARGHQLHDGALRRRPVDARAQTGIAIVGAGVAGLSAAWRLERAGFHDFRVLELEDEVGGTARGGRLPRSPHPLGAHYLPRPEPRFVALERLLEDLGVIIGRDQSGRAEYAPSTIVAASVERHMIDRIWYEGISPEHGATPAERAESERWYAHLRQLDREGPDGRRHFTLPSWRASAAMRNLDAISMRDYLAHMGVKSWRLRWEIDYACRDDYGCALAQTSAYAGLHHFLARGYDEDDPRPLLAWPDGNAELTRRIAARLGHLPGTPDQKDSRVRTGAAVLSVEPERGVLRVHHRASDRVVELSARAILWAAPRFILPHVLERGRDPLEGARGLLSYAPWLVASVELRERPGGVGTPLAWDNVPVEHDNLGYVVATHGEDRSVTDPGAVITYYEPLTADTPAALRARRAELLAGDLSYWSDHVVRQLARMHPGIERQVTRVNVTRWGHAMIRPTPGLLFGDALARARAPIGRLRACATDVTGLPLFEQAFYSGLEAAEQVLASASLGFGRVVTSMIPT